MADYRTRNRTHSIFSDDDRGGERWGGDPGRDAQARRGRLDARDERGFFEKAGDEVRAWFGDDEAERRREQDARRDGREPDDDRFRQPGDADRWSGNRAGRQEDARHERSPLRSNQASRPAEPWGDGERGGFGGHHDESYRRWRDEQIATLDREYDEYRSHRQKQFEQDFSSFRQNRQTRITSGGPTLGQPGGDAATQVTASAAGADRSARQGAGELSTGTETVMADQPGQSASRTARTR